MNSHQDLAPSCACDYNDQGIACFAGTERSGSSFSSSVTGRLTYADLGGAAWGAPAEAKTGTSLAPPVTLFPASTAAAAGPFNISTSATTGNDIGQLWAPEPPRPAAATQPHKQQRHKREVSLSDLGYLGFVARDEQNGPSAHAHVFALWHSITWCMLQGSAGCPFCCVCLT